MPIQICWKQESMAASFSFSFSFFFGAKKKKWQLFIDAGPLIYGRNDNVG